MDDAGTREEAAIRAFLLGAKVRGAVAATATERTTTLGAGDAADLLRAERTPQRKVRGPTARAASQELNWAWVWVDAGPQEEKTQTR